jgi:hypothetical protein
VFSLNIYSQKARVATADKKYDNYAFECHKTYERLADKGYKSVDMFQNWETTSMEARKAAQWYGELFTMTSEVEPAYYYRYAQSLRSISDKTNHGEI